MINTGFEDIYEQTVVDPGALSAATVPASYIDVSNYERFQFKLDVGATDQAIALQVVQATAAAGTGSKNVTGAAITALAGTDDNKQVIVEVETRKLDINNGFHFVAVTIGLTGGTGTTGYVEFRGLNPGVKPVTQPAAFAQQVLVAG
ncbi:MAG: hypothetical protein IAE79_07650 [Anaerolinea sp.]|nr:hypothetical protein [Anaerolinea sp.]